MVVQKLLNVDKNQEKKNTLDFLFEKKSGDTYTFFSKHPESELNTWKKRIKEGEIWVDVDFQQAKIISYAKQPPWKKTGEREPSEIKPIPKPVESQIFPSQCKKVIIKGDFVIDYKNETLYITTNSKDAKKK